MRTEPHNFSRSPVKEVICSCTFESEEPFLLRVLAPYPGWACIRQDIHDILKGMPETVTVTGCRLQYTDIFHPVSLDGCSGPHFLGLGEYSGIRDRIIGRKGDDLQISSSIPGSDIYIRHKNGGNRGQGSTLIFTVNAGSLSQSVEETILWFDAAHDQIHILFDLCIPPGFIESIR